MAKQDCDQAFRADDLNQREAEIAAIAAATIADDWVCLPAVKKGTKTNSAGRL